MQKNFIIEILKQVEKGKLNPDQAFQKLKDLPFQELGFAKIDHHRMLRKEIPETVFCPGKRPEQVIKIFQKMAGKTNILATKASGDIIKAVIKKFPRADIYPDSGIIFSGKYPEPGAGKVILLSAGTSDIKIAEEALITLKALGVYTLPIYDVGVAGIHRLLHYKEDIQSADIIIAVAGMDGVLPTVVAGLFALPVIAVPTSVGYGSNFSGLAPLLTMLNSCAPGVTVVNIDNGYGAACFASLIVRQKGKK